MNWFWHALWICFVVIPVTILWIICILDVIFNRGDLVWWKRLGYLVLVLVPFIGPIIYACVSPLFRHPREDAYDEGADLHDRSPLVDMRREQVIG